MSLSDLIESDVKYVMLNADDYGITRRVTPVSGPGRQVDMLFHETAEQQTIRRAEIRVGSGVDLQVGSIFQQHGRTWRLHYQSTESHGMRHWFCHERLPDRVMVLNKEWSKSPRGVDVWNHPDVGIAYFAKIFRNDGETTEGRRRIMQSEFRIYFEEHVRPTTEQVIVDRNGNSYKAQTYDRPPDNALLTTVFCRDAQG